MPSPTQLAITERVPKGSSGHRPGPIVALHVEPAVRPEPAPDVAELGLKVTRVLAPELCPLEVSHSARFLGGTRLYEAAASIGLRPDVLPFEDVNPDPHPFP